MRMPAVRALPPTESMAWPECPCRSISAPEASHMGEWLLQDAMKEGFCANPSRGQSVGGLGDVPSL